MEKKCYKDKTKIKFLNNGGSIIFLFLLILAITSIFTLTLFQTKKTNEKIYRIHELYICHKHLKSTYLDYLEKQININHLLRTLSYANKLIHLKPTIAPLISSLKMGQETLYLFFHLKYKKKFICQGIIKNFFVTPGLLKRKVFFTRNKITNEILLRQNTKYFIYSKHIPYGIRTTYTYTKGKITHDSTLIKTTKSIFQ